MASLFQKIVAQINPFDQGATFKNPTPQRKPQPKPRPQGPRVNLQQLNQAFQQQQQGSKLTFPQPSSLPAVLTGPSPLKVSAKPAPTPFQQMQQKAQQTPYKRSARDYGAERGVIGAGQAIAGIIDLLPSKGTNRYSKIYDQQAKALDEKIKKSGLSKSEYLQGQVGMNAILAIPGLFTGSTEAAAGTALAKAAGKISPKTAQVITKVPEVIKTLESKGPAGKIAASAIKGGVSPTAVKANLVGSTAYLGSQTGKGVKITPQDIATTYGLGAVGGAVIPAAGRAVGLGAQAAGRGAIKGIQAAGRGLETGAQKIATGMETMPRPQKLGQEGFVGMSNLTPEERKMAAKQGVTPEMLQKGTLVDQQGKPVPQPKTQPTIGPEPIAPVQQPKVPTKPVKVKLAKNQEVIQPTVPVFTSVKKDQNLIDQLVNPPVGKIKTSTAFRKQAGKVAGIQERFVPKTQYVSKTKSALDTAATNLINKNLDLADSVFTNNHVLETAPDSHARLGNALFEHYVKTEQIDKANETFAQLTASGSRAGQALSAYNFASRISPTGIVNFAAKVADKKGKKLTQDKIDQLKVLATQASNMGNGPEKDQLIKNMMTLANDPSLWDKTVKFGENILSIPKALMASADLSWGARQGAILGARYPKEWAKAQAESVKMAGSQKYFDKVNKDIANLKDKNGVALAPVFKRMGLALESVYGKSEEVFGATGISKSKLAKKLLIGHIVAGSDRAFSGASSIMRSEVARKIINDYGGVKAANKMTTKELKDLGRVINTATGRGKGGATFESAAPALGRTLFSARLWKSRLDTLNPAYYAKLSPPARKVALQSATSFAGVVSAVLGAAAVAGADIESDPRSSDFGKIRIGNSRYDIMAGLQQNIVAAARVLTGEKKNLTGEVVKVNRAKVLSDLVQSKEAPVVALAGTLLSGKGRFGQPVNPWMEVAKLFIPLGIQDTAQAAQTEKSLAQGVIRTAPSFFGVGTATYKTNPPKSDYTPEQWAKLTSDQKIKAVFNKPEELKFIAMSKEDKAKAIAENPALQDLQNRIDAERIHNTPDKVYPGLDKTSSATLNKFNKMTPDEKKKEFYGNKKADYEYALAQYNLKKSKNEYTKAKDLEERIKLGKLKTESNFDKSTREIYKLSKNELRLYLANDPNAEDTKNKLIALDNALKSAGDIKHKKFAKGIGTSTGGGGGTSTASGKKVKALRLKLSKVSKPKAVKLGGIKAKQTKFATTKIPKATKPKRIKIS